MAIQANATYNGIELRGAYIGISKTRTQKIYQRDESGNIIGEQYATWSHLNVSTNHENWINGVTLNKNHCVVLNGDLDRAGCWTAIMEYVQENPINIGDVVVDWATAVEV